MSSDAIVVPNVCAELQLAGAHARDLFAAREWVNTVVVRRQPRGQQVDVIEPQQPWRVLMVHHRMNTRQQQRIDDRPCDGGRPERRERNRAGRASSSAQHVGEHRLRADVPMNVEGVCDAEPIALLHFELREQSSQYTVGVKPIDTSASRAASTSAGGIEEIGVVARAAMPGVGYTV